MPMCVTAEALPGHNPEPQIQVFLNYLYPDPKFGITNRTWKGRGAAKSMVATYHLLPQNEPLRSEFFSNDLPWHPCSSSGLGTHSIHETNLSNRATWYQT